MRPQVDTTPGKNWPAFPPAERVMRRPPITGQTDASGNFVPSSPRRGEALWKFLQNFPKSVRGVGCYQGRHPNDLDALRGTYTLRAKDQLDELVVGDVGKIWAIDGCGVDDRRLRGLAP